MFHWRDGWHFRRLPDGSVEILKDFAHELPGDDRKLVRIVPPIPADEWPSIVAAVSAAGETTETYQAAGRLHRGESE